MSQRLEDELEELQLSQYYEAFVDQGFDTWETILDITESDLDALGVKLGHRRKLQRRIANYRGVAPDVALASPTRTSADDASRPEPASKQDPPSTSFNLDSRGAVPGVLAKRKYRRHPKPDENAPERPPSAYVLFSNKTREELKGQNLTFTEIAKHVGENWQGLSAAEREPFETQAQVAKDKYSQDLSEYKKTDEYKQYMVYLQDFKAKHSGNQTQEKDAFKRIKLADFSTSSTPTLGNSSASPPATHHRDHDHERRNKRKSDGLNGHGSRSSSEGPHDNDNHINRKRRLGSTASGSDYTASPTPGLIHSPTTLNHQPVDSKHSNPTQLYRSPSSRPTSLSPHVHAASTLPPNHGQATSIRRSDSGGSSQMSLPSLSHMFHDDRHPHSPTTNGPMSGPKPDTGSNSRATPGTVSPGLPPHGNSMATSSSSASNTSNGSATSYSTASSNGSGSYPRTPLDGSMPIHALLSGTNKPLSPTSPHSSSASPHSASIPPHPQPYPPHSGMHHPLQHSPPYPTQHQPQHAYPHHQPTHAHHGPQPQGPPPPPYHRAVSPKHSPPPSASWNYPPHGRSPADHPPMYKDHGVGSMIRQPAGAPYPPRY